MTLLKRASYIIAPNSTVLFALFQRGGNQACIFTCQGV